MLKFDKMGFLGILRCKGIYQFIKSFKAKDTACVLKFDNCLKQNIFVKNVIVVFSLLKFLNFLEVFQTQFCGCSQ